MPAIPATIWLLFAAAMVISSIGFKNYVWFISLGYGFSIAGEGLLMLLLFRENLTAGTIVCCVLFILYGLRLGGYLAIRELKSSSYKVSSDSCCNTAPYLKIDTSKNTTITTRIIPTSMETLTI